VIHKESKKLLLHTETVIDSAHYLEGYDGKCRDYHGHSWRIRIWIKGLESDRDSVGILFDFGNVKELKELLDHKMINDVVDFNPTAENLSLYVYGFLKGKNSILDYCVRIYETSVGKETWCQYGDFEV
jgi:6-pyruvoyltetrahydropterin/6-carboxytetrahydropterin synthase